MVWVIGLVSRLGKKARVIFVVLGRVKSYGFWLGLGLRLRLKSG